MTFDVLGVPASQPDDQFLVLANSMKVGGRCVAVVDVDGHWFRPVSDTRGGELYGPDQINPANGQSLLPLDVVRADFKHARPEAHQPEDWACPKWQQGTRLTREDLVDWLSVVVNNDSEIVTRGTTDRVPEAQVLGEPLSSSLALIAPERLELYLWDSPWGIKRRARFTVPGVSNSDGGPTEFNLGMTDPTWGEQLAAHNDRTITLKGGSVDAGALFLTISIGGLYQARTSSWWPLSLRVSRSRPLHSVRPFYHPSESEMNRINASPLFIEVLDDKSTMAFVRL